MDSLANVIKHSRLLLASTNGFSQTNFTTLITDILMDFAFLSSPIAPRVCIRTAQHTNWVDRFAHVANEWLISALLLLSNCKKHSANNKKNHRYVENRERQWVEVRTRFFSSYYLFFSIHAAIVNIPML
jgi:hypothetical protein